MFSSSDLLGGRLEITELHRWGFLGKASSIGQTYEIVGELEVLSAETYVRMQIKMIKYVLPVRKRVVELVLLLVYSYRFSFFHFCPSDFIF